MTADGFREHCGKPGVLLNGCFAEGGALWPRKPLTTSRFFRDDEQTTARLPLGKPRQAWCPHRVHGDKQLEEKLGRNDLCPCGSGKRFKRCCVKKGYF
jgi:hypothetical protein